MCRQSAGLCPIKAPSRHRGLPQRLAALADSRHRRGKRHPFVSVLLIACSAVPAGPARSPGSASGPRTLRRRLSPRSVSAPPACSPSAFRRARRRPAACGTTPPVPAAWPTCSEPTRQLPPSTARRGHEDIRRRTSRLRTAVGRRPAAARERAAPPARTVPTTHLAPDAQRSPRRQSGSLS
jgi:hypothetical protein